MFTHTISTDIHIGEDGLPEYVVLHNATDIPMLAQHQILQSALAGFFGGYGAARKAFIIPAPLDKGDGWTKFRVINRA